jgi:uncharacterized membrane-anchored protein
MGYLASGIVFGLLILVPLDAWRFGLNGVLAFWWAYVLTRPLGASFADYVSKARSIGGINFGDGRTEVVALVAVAVLVRYLQVARADIQSGPASTVARPRPGGRSTGDPVPPGATPATAFEPGP